MIKATILVPVRDNDGRNLSDELTLLQADLMRAFGAFTDLGRAKGSWRNDKGIWFTDEHKVFVVCIDDLQVHSLKNILLDFKRHTLQESIYVELTRDVQLLLV